ncbi:MAG TPA: response regulator transcription factor [Chitinophagaceae bacterium]|nr:response regulator transcription factor [Chitinophagaceae bacterium]
MPAIKDLIRIAVADDDLSVLQLFCNHINTLDKCKVVIQATNGIELLKAMKEKPEVDLVILDIKMPLVDGYEIAKYIRKSYPGIRVVFYSVFKSELAHQLMVVSGGHGLIEKSKSIEEAKKVIKTVIKGKYCFPALEEEIEINGEKNISMSRNSLVDITPAEINFMRLSVADLPYKQIAAELHISERQVEYMRDTMFKKLNVHSKVGLVIKALECGFVTLPPADIPEYLFELRTAI